MLKPVLERFLEKISVSNVNFYNGTPCWDWTACKTSGGYGQFWVPPKVEYTHRILYEYFNGKIPEVLVINHECRNRKCCNPQHLEVITHQGNILKGIGTSAINASKPTAHKVMSIIKKIPIIILMDLVDVEFVVEIT